MVLCPELLAVFHKRLVGEEPRLAALKQTSSFSVRSFRPVLPHPDPAMLLETPVVSMPPSPLPSRERERETRVCSTYIKQKAPLGQLRRSQNYARCVLLCPREHKSHLLGGGGLVQ